MRIALVITVGDAGGAQAHVLDLAAGLRERHELMVVAGGQGWLAERLRALGVRFARVPELTSPIRPGLDMQATANLAGLLRDFRPDLVHAHSFKASHLARVAAALVGTPTVVTPHGWNFNAGYGLRRRAVGVAVEAASGRLCRRVICVCEADRQLAIRLRVLPADRLVTVHNGVSDDPRRATPGAAATPPVLLTVGRLVAEKDHPTLLRALAQVRAPLQLDIVGDGPREGELRALIGELGLSDRVRLLGHQDDVPDRLAAAHAFALVSHKEGFPISILEAMRAGLPVVASAVAGVPEAVADGHSGYLVGRGEVTALADRLHWLATQPALRERMGAAGRARYEAEFTAARMVAKVERVYEDALATPSRRPWRRFTRGERP